MTSATLDSKLPARRPTFFGRAAIAGVGYTDMTGEGKHSAAALAARACLNAIADAGLKPADIDGVASFGLFGDSITSQAAATAMGLGPLSYTLDSNNGGSQPCFLVLNAAMAVASGLANTVVVFRSLRGRSGRKLGSVRFDAPTSQFRYPIGLTAYPQYIAMWARRFMIETGTSEKHLAAVVTTQREYAARNERAFRRALLTEAEYFERPYVVEPFRSVDCTVEVDAGIAVVVTSLDRARDLPNPPAVISGGAWVNGRGSGLDIADLHSWPDFTLNCQHYLAPRLWASAGLGPSDIDVAEIYDCFSPAVLFGLEGLGFVGRGEAGDFVASGETRLGGVLPVNTHGGLINEGYVHGMNSVAEAALQIQQRGGDRQVEGAECALATSGVLVDGSALILTSDR
jgi:acetyl-CoA acetyltransferase